MMLSDWKISAKAQGEDARTVVAPTCLKIPAKPREDAWPVVDLKMMKHIQIQRMRP